jgi:non-ribosomal peptide synthetase component F
MANLVHTLFEEQVSRGADRIALEIEGNAVTYGALNARANRFAWSLLERDIGPECLVPLFLERSIDMVAAMLGVLKSGAAFVPLRLLDPPDRIADTLRAMKARWILTQHEWVERLPLSDVRTVLLGAEASVAAQPVHNPGVSMSADGVAYVTFTSGSTSQPQGVMNLHRGVVNFCTFFGQGYGLGAQDRVLQIQPYSFNGVIRDLLGPLSIGARASMPS